jgi:hypothetical protein
MSFALMASPLSAEPQSRSTPSGTVKIEMTAQDADGQTRPKPDDALTIHIVQPPHPADVDEDQIQQKLAKCGAKWNKKLDDYQARLPKLKKYRAYYDKWENYAAQRPPRSPEPLLTRASYRACMYECLGDVRVACPGGWGP